MKKIKIYLTEMLPKNWSKECTATYALTIWISILILLIVSIKYCNYIPTMNDVTIIILFTFSGLVTGYFFGKHVK